MNNAYYYNGKVSPYRNQVYYGNDERIGGFLGPFILGGITGGLVAPFFYGPGRPPGPIYPPRPYPPRPYPPRPYPPRPYPPFWSPYYR